MSDVVRKLSEILIRLPSEFREDYPKSVPNYVIQDITKFNNTYKSNLGYIKNYTKKLESDFQKLEKDNKIMREALEYYADMPTQYMVLMNLDVNEKARKALKEIDNE